MNNGRDNKGMGKCWRCRSASPACSAAPLFMPIRQAESDFDTDFVEIKYPDKEHISLDQPISRMRFVSQIDNTTDLSTVPVYLNDTGSLQFMLQEEDRLFTVGQKTPVKLDHFITVC